MSHPLRTLLAAGTDPGCGRSEACTVWEPSLRKKNTKLQIQNLLQIQNYRHKIRSKSEFLHRMSKQTHTASFLKTNKYKKYLTAQGFRRSFATERLYSLQSKPSSN